MYDEAEQKTGKDRGLLHRLFRKNLERLQKPVCPISSLTFNLEACHILPWKLCTEPGQKANPSNGILMAPHVHKLFEQFYVTLYHVESTKDEYVAKYYDPELADGPYTEADKHLALLLNNAKLKLPHITDRSFIQWHNKEFERNTQQYWDETN